MSIYTERRQKLFNLMAEENVAFVIFEDTEARRDPAVRWLTGQPGDALLVLTANGHSMLIPWDVQLAIRLAADAEIIVPYNEFDRQALRATRSAADYFNVPFGA
jgi:Xaa-Pro dipeptidase